MMVILVLGKCCLKIGIDEFEKYCYRGGWWIDVSIMELILVFVICE